MRTSEGKTSFQIAREALDKAGLNDVQVKKAGFFRALFFGNLAKYFFECLYEQCSDHIA